MDKRSDRENWKTVYDACVGKHGDKKGCSFRVGPTLVRNRNRNLTATHEVERPQAVMAWLLGLTMRIVSQCSTPNLFYF